MPNKLVLSVVDPKEFVRCIFEEYDKNIFLKEQHGMTWLKTRLALAVDKRDSRILGDIKKFYGINDKQG